MIDLAPFVDDNASMAMELADSQVSAIPVRAIAQVATGATLIFSGHTNPNYNNSMPVSGL